MSKTSFCVVNWNGGETFRLAIQSILAEVETEGLDAEIVIVDNGSSDGSIEALPRDDRICVIRNKHNEFFAQATNQSIAAAKGETLVILNNDIVFPRNTLGPYLQALAQRPNSVICPRLQNGDGTPQLSIRNILTPAIFLSITLGVFNKGAPQWILNNFNPELEQIVEQPLFSLIFLKRFTFDQVGFMDTRFPLFFNDVDWFKRAKESGVKTYYVPGPAVTHIHGYSTKRRPFRKVISSTHSMARYFFKHYPIQAGLFLPLVMASALVRLLRKRP